MYAPQAEGDAVPLRTLRGPRTGLAQPIGLALDAAGRLHVANRAPGAGVTVHAADAEGDAPPLRCLRVPGFCSAQAVAVAPADAVFVACAAAVDRVASVLRFAPGETCGEAVIRGPATGLAYPVGLAIDARGMLLVANGFGGVVAVYAADARGAPTPLRTFTPAVGSARGLASAPGLLLVSGACLCLYPPEAPSDARPVAVFGRSARLPLQAAGGVAIGTGVAPPVLAVADFAGNAVHLIGTSGVAPVLGLASVRTIRGRATGLDRPSGVAFAPQDVSLAFA
ncbi:MAG: hypothetical protein ACM3N6_15650 [Betaproteobacteria bacterium]